MEAVRVIALKLIVPDTINQNLIYNIFLKGSFENFTTLECEAASLNLFICLNAQNAEMFVYDTKIIHCHKITETTLA